MDLHKLYLSEQLEGIKSGEFSSTELTTHYLERISKFDEDLNSFITVTEDQAIAQAKKSDEDTRIKQTYHWMVCRLLIKISFVQKMY